MSAPQPGDRASVEQPGPQRRSWPRRILLTLLALLGLGVVGLGVAYAVTDVPQPNDLATAETSVIYYADGKTELDRIAEVNRESVPLAEVPEHVRYAMLAAEDRSFYENSGISPTGIARAAWVTLRGGQTQGGSTITQQYVKNYFLTRDQTISRKVRELLISVKIARDQSKDQILENYLNTIYFGRAAYGIQAASQAYFGVDVGDLTVEQGAVLASVIRGPSLYDPGLGEEQQAAVQARWDYVLDGMVSEGWLSADERAGATFPETTEYRPRTSSGTTGYLTALVQKELRTTVALSDSDIARGGLRIVSTFEKPRQDDAVKAVRNGMPDGAKDLHVGLASVTPGDGAVVALYGGKNYAKEQFNTATDATMQAGSTFKIFSLIGALRSGDMSIRNAFSGASPQYFKEFASGGATEVGGRGRVTNFGNQSFGTLDVRAATASSVNTIYAQINIIGTPKRTVAAAKAAGITTELEANYANVFGTDNVKVLDMANAYATIAAKGQRAVPYVVRSVTSEDQAFAYEAQPQLTRAFDKDVMADVTYCMEAVVQSGSGAYAGSNLGRPAAGKTGTTSDNYAAWFDGFVPQLGTAVGIYKGDGSITDANRMNNVPGVGEMTGGTVPVRIWTDYMQAALEGVDVKGFPEPAYVNGDAAPRRTGPPAPPAPTREPAPSTPAPSTSKPPTTSAPPSPTTSPSAPTAPSPKPSSPPSSPPPTSARPSPPKSPSVPPKPRPKPRAPKPSASTSR